MSVEYRRGRSPDALADLPDGCASLVLTDPPYGTGRDGAIYGRRRDGKVNHIANDSDLSALTECAPFFSRWLAPDGLALVFCAPQFRRHTEAIIERSGLVPLHCMPWDKGAPGISYQVRYAYEDVVLAAHPEVDPWEIRDPMVVPIRFPKVRNPEHPNEKPVGLLRRYIRWACPVGGLVIDPFAGIASGALAAHAERCEWIGVELDEQWWPIAERRIADVLHQPHPALPQNNLFTQPRVTTMSDIRRARRNQDELEAQIIAHLSTEPANTSVRSVGNAVSVPAGTAQQVLARLAKAGRIEAVATEGRATLWRVVKEAAVA